MAGGGEDRNCGRTWLPASCGDGITNVSEVKLAAQLNIKDAEPVRLAKELGAKPERTATPVIRQALERESNLQEEIIAEKIRQVKELSGSVSV